MTKQRGWIVSLWVHSSWDRGGTWMWSSCISLLHPFHGSQTHASGMFMAGNLVLCFALLSSLYLLPGASLLECLSKARAPSILASLYSYVFKTSLPFIFLAVHCRCSTSPGISNLHWRSSVSLPCFPILQKGWFLWVSEQGLIQEVQILFKGHVFFIVLSEDGFNNDTLLSIWIDDIFPYPLWFKEHGMWVHLCLELTSCFTSNLSKLHFLHWENGSTMVCKLRHCYWRWK